jgi:AdoMet-dependent rRNA methyltransferase SPB1
MELEDYDPDDLAHNLVLAKKMLRKRNKDSIMDNTYSKYAYDSDDENLPDWYNKIFRF